MTQQLYTWEYKGDYWIGYKRDDGSLGGISKQGWQGIVCSQVTNLRPAKVVDADAVVIEEVLSCMSYQVNSDGTKFKYKIEGFAVDWEPSPKVTKTYLTTEQFIIVWKSLDDAKIKELSAAWSVPWHVARAAARSAAWSARDAARDVAWNAARSARYAARYAACDVDLAVLAKDKITAEQFEILTSPWISCGLSLFAEDWDEVLNPPVTEPTGSGAIVEAESKFYRDETLEWQLTITKSRDKWMNKYQSFACWSDLINPVVISEGQK